MQENQNLMHTPVILVSHQCIKFDMFRLCVDEYAKHYEEQRKREEQKAKAKARWK